MAKAMGEPMQSYNRLSTPHPTVIRRTSYATVGPWGLPSAVRTELGSEVGLITAYEVGKDLILKLYLTFQGLVILFRAVSPGKNGLMA